MSTQMHAEKVGIREFRDNVAGYLEAGRPLATTRHGQTLGFFIRTQMRNRKAEVEAMRATAKEFYAMIATRGASDEKLIDEISRATREKKRGQWSSSARCQYSDFGLFWYPGQAHPYCPSA